MDDDVLAGVEDNTACHATDQADYLEERDPDDMEEKENCNAFQQEAIYAI